MPRNAERGGPQTRARIAETANALFDERGFDAVTVAEVARAAGVSSVTVFNHFPRKEDLYLDRSQEAVDLIRAAVLERSPGQDAVEALRAAALRLSAERHPLSGVDPRSGPFYRTVAGSPALIARAREIGAELQSALAAALEDDAGFDGDSALLAAFVLSGYSVVMVEIAARFIAGDAPEQIASAHPARLERLFDALRSSGLSSP